MKYDHVCDYSYFGRFNFGSTSTVMRADGCIHCSSTLMRCKKTEKRLANLRRDFGHTHPALTLDPLGTGIIPGL